VSNRDASEIDEFITQYVHIEDNEETKSQYPYIRISLEFSAITILQFPSLAERKRDAQKSRGENRQELWSRALISHFDWSSHNDELVHHQLLLTIWREITDPLVKSDENSIDCRLRDTGGPGEFPDPLTNEKADRQESGGQEEEEGKAFVITGELAQCAVDERVAVGVQFAEV